jgi:hypothetical protein
MRSIQKVNDISITKYWNTLNIIYFQPLTWLYEEFYVEGYMSIFENNFSLKLDNVFSSLDKLIVTLKRIKKFFYLQFIRY